MPKLVCRLCLQTLNGQKYYDINTVETNSGFMPFRDQITSCIPEVAIDLVPESLICTACAESLKTAYEFKTKCLQVEERIRTYFDMKKDKSNYDLSDLVIESVTCDIYKKETEEDDGYDPLQIKVKEEVIEIKEEKSTTKIVCSTCGQVFKNHAEWKHHDHFHVSPTQFTCNFCKEGFASLQCLRRHNSTCVQSGKTTKDTILTKRPHLPCQAKNHLTEWLFNHQHHPYPTDTEKQILMQETNLTLLQVENWFINARRRVLQDFSRRKKYSRLKM